MMRSNFLLLLSLLLPLTSAQAPTGPPINQALSSRREFSTFRTLLEDHPALSDVLAQLSPQGKTLFIPTNAAFAASGLDVSALSATDIAELVRYHIVNGTVTPQTMNRKGGVTLETYLDSGNSANLGGGGQGNVVYISRFGDTGLGQKRGGDGGDEEDNNDAEGGIQVFTGLGKAATVQGVDDDDELDDIDLDDNDGPGSFEGGLFYPVNSLFTLPRNCSTTAASNYWLSLLTAFTRTNLTNYVDTVPRITCFAPSDSAFAKLGNPQNSLPPDDLAKALQRHTLVGDYIAYSDMWGEIGGPGVQHETLAGNMLTLRRDEDGMYVDGVKVSKGNVLVSNGVAHVLDEVLPEPNENATATRTSTASATARPTQSGTPQDDDDDGDDNTDGQGAAGKLGVGYALMAGVMAVGAMVGL